MMSFYKQGPSRKRVVLALFVDVPILGLFVGIERYTRSMGVGGWSSSTAIHTSVYMPLVVVARLQVARRVQLYTGILVPEGV